jgi:hypothetical protein
MTRGVFNPINSKTEVRHSARGNTCGHFALYAITCDQYDEMRRQADYRCEICGKPESDCHRGRLVIDHHHGGQGFPWHVRGLLCGRCNSVMAAVDGKRKWGSDRSLETKALAYAANSWQTPAGSIRVDRKSRAADDVSPEAIEVKVGARIRINVGVIEGNVLRRNKTHWLVDVGGVIFHIPVEVLAPIDDPKLIADLAARSTASQSKKAHAALVARAAEALLTA